MTLLHVDLRWLLDVQELASPEDLSVRDYSALQAAVARHRVNTAQLGHDADPAWCAATLMHTIVLLRPLPVRNNLYACMTTAAYMHAAGEGIDPPYGALVELARDVAEARADVYEAADRIRGWRI
ncbi:toxin Doc [Kitasatospora sp. NPDC004669]|uniref:toxin Doc n=1 Tax=Kitasatospora sp. NPDC004669 TaxID=3154555 RepID=UPI0033B6B7C8